MSLELLEFQLLQPVPGFFPGSLSQLRVSQADFLLVMPYKLLIEVSLELLAG